MQPNTAQRLLEESFGAADAIGRVILVRGSTAAIGLRGDENPGDRNRVTVGDFLAIDSGESLVIAVVTEATIESPPTAREHGFSGTAHADLVGEIRVDREQDQRFQRGVSRYPSLGNAAIPLSEEQLRLVYGLTEEGGMAIGNLHQDVDLKANVYIDDMLQKHFAVLGTTGVGKSSGVSVLLHSVMEKRPDLRVFLIDPHNEYGSCFGERARTLTPANLRLPFWLFNFEEIVDIFYRGRPGLDEEIQILSDVIPLAKKIYGRASIRDVRAAKGSDLGYTVDTPVPYRLADMMSLIDERMGKLENLSSRSVHGKLLQRISTVVNDPRYGFMFEGANVGGDTMASVIGELFRLPTDGCPMTVMQLAGFPAETVDSVVSVLGRMAFDFGLWSDGALPLLFVCEEAHRYASGNRNLGFGPTRRAISRIAKEGRKYGVFLGLVSQRPAELDQTILSQCSTMFVMRMANERDQAIIRSAVSDAAASLLAFVPSLGTREVFAFGEGVAMPTRLKFRQLQPEQLPHSEAVSDSGSDFGRTVERSFIDVVVDRWRGATLSNRLRITEENGDQPAGKPAARPLDPERYRILKKPAGSS